MSEPSASSASPPVLRFAGPEDLDRFMSHDDGFPTATFEEQRRVEQLVYTLYFAAMEDPERLISLQRDLADAISELVLSSAAGSLHKSMSSLAASRPWIAFWSLRAYDLVGGDARDPRLRGRCIELLRACKDQRNGGFGGGPGQPAHIASTYAAVHALALVGALEEVDHAATLSFLRAMKNRVDGSFAMCPGGEHDLRAVYCALATASLLGFGDDELLCADAVRYVARCQGPDGGLGAAPGCEAHGGYTYCGVAVVALIGGGSGADLNGIDLAALARWSALRQMRFEGGMQGRANKLVDSCYSFWVGALPVALTALFETRVPRARRASKEAPARPPFAYDARALSEYVYVCCTPGDARDGGLADKPGKHADTYHTCYALSGLAVTMHGYEYADGDFRFSGPVDENGIGHQHKVRPTHPLHNISFAAYAEARMIALARINSEINKI